MIKQDTIDNQKVLENKLRESQTVVRLVNCDKFQTVLLRKLRLCNTTRSEQQQSKIVYFFSILTLNTSMFHFSKRTHQDREPSHGQLI